MLSEKRDLIWIFDGCFYLPDTLMNAFVDLFVAESQNGISGVGQVGILTFVTSFYRFSVMPVSTIALNNYWMMFQKKINHEFVEQRNLFVKFYMMLFKFCGHCFFDAGSLTCCQTLEIAAGSTFFRAIPSAPCPGWIRFKIIAAFITSHLDFFFPFVIVFPTFCKSSGGVKALFGAINLLVSHCFSDSVFLMTLRTNLFDFRKLSFCMNLSQVQKTAFFRTVFGCILGRDNEFFAASFARLVNERSFSALITTKNMLTFPPMAWVHFNRGITDRTWINGHKKSPICVSWSLAEGVPCAR